MKPQSPLVWIVAVLLFCTCSGEPPAPRTEVAAPPDSRWPDRLSLASPGIGPLNGEWFWRPALIEPEHRIAYLERSLATPLSEAEMKVLSRPSATNPFTCLQGEELQRRFRDRVRWLLVHQWRLRGNPEKVQSLIESICAECPGGVPRWHYARRAGESERDTGSDVIRDRILAAEVDADRDRDYWTSRAEYFLGRGDHEEAVRSFVTAVRAQPWVLHVGNATHEPGGLALRQFVAYLGERREGAAALVLLTGELERNMPDTDAAYWLIRMIFECADPSAHLSRSDPWLWAYLRNRGRWADFEGTLIRWMAGEGAGSEEFWSRLERMVEGTHPTRPRELAYALLRCGMEDRALPLLRAAMRGLRTHDGKREVALSILRIRPGDEEARVHAVPAK